MIIPIWKKIGQSTHQLAKKVGELTAAKSNNQEDTKATHTGTLDPMAEGVVVVLTAKDRFNKADYSNWTKEYEFFILFGVDTDSNDLLGLQKRIIKKQLDLDKVTKDTNKLFPNFTGEFNQTQPTFSAQRIDGESAFDKAKRGENIVAKKNHIKISYLKILDSTNITTDDLLTTIKKRINLVNGDFRQAEIISNWENTINQLEKNKINKLPLLRLKAEVSKKTYIRSLVRDISQKLNIPATTFHIIRTKNGKFTRLDCK